MERIINLKGISTKTLLFRSKDAKQNCIMLEAINETQEKIIDRLKSYEVVTTSGKKIIVPMHDIHMYGEINLEDKNDISLIQNKGFVGDMLGENPSYIKSNFDYKEGTFTTIGGIAKHTPIEDVLQWFKYNYCKIGKPVRIICYQIPKVLLT